MWLWFGYTYFMRKIRTEQNISAFKMCFLQWDTPQFSWLSMSWCYKCIFSFSSTSASLIEPYFTAQKKKGALSTLRVGSHPADRRGVSHRPSAAAEAAVAVLTSGNKASSRQTAGSAGTSIKEDWQKPICGRPTAGKSSPRPPSLCQLHYRGMPSHANLASKTLKAGGEGAGRGGSRWMGGGVRKGRERKKKTLFFLLLLVFVLCSTV